MPKTSKKSKGSKKVKIVSKPNVNGNGNNTKSKKRRTLSKLFNALRISQRVATPYPYPRPSRQIRCKTLYP